MLRAMPWASVSRQDFARELSSTLVTKHWMPGMGLLEDESRTRTGTIGPLCTVKSLVATGASAERTPSWPCPPTDQYPGGASNRPMRTWPNGTSIA